MMILATVVLFVSCEKSQTENPAVENATVLQAKLDSIQTILDENAYQLGVLEQVSLYMDSIDANRKWIKLNLETGIAEEDYVERMKSISMYMQKAEWTIGELEKTRSAYASQVKRLKATVIEKEAEINALQLSVAQVQEKNEALTTMLKASENQLAEANNQLVENSAEIAAIEEQVNQLKGDVQLTKAESAYAQAEGMEELAGKIHFSKKKKEETLDKALDLYKTSKELGYEPAAIKWATLKSEMKK